MTHFDVFQKGAQITDFDSNEDSTSVPIAVRAVLSRCNLMGHQIR